MKGAESREKERRGVKIRGEERRGEERRGEEKTRALAWNSWHTHTQT